MSLQLAVSLLALVSLTAAADPTCETLVTPRQDMSSISGKWVFVVATWDREGLKQSLEMLLSSWLDMSPTSSSGERTIYYADRLTNSSTCYRGYGNSTVTGSTGISTFDVFGQISRQELKYYETCPDCMLMEYTSLLPNATRGDRFLFLWTRTGDLDAAQLETFKKQAECLNFLPEYLRFSNTDLCADIRETSAP